MPLFVYTFYFEGMKSSFDLSIPHVNVNITASKRQTQIPQIDNRTIYKSRISNFNLKKKENWLNITKFSFHLFSRRFFTLQNNFIGPYFIIFTIKLYTNGKVIKLWRITKDRLSSSSFDCKKMVQQIHKITWILPFES